MTIRATPPISLSDVMAELRVTNPGRAYPISLGDADVRALAGKASGPISLSDLYGKSSIAPLTVTAVNDSGTADSRFGAGSVGCSPGVAISGGVGTKTCSWVVLSNPKGCAVTLGTGPTVYVSYSYANNSNGSAEVLLRCTVTDQAGTQRTVDNISGYLQWDGNM
jgi:hypothetical protein